MFQYLVQFRVILTQMDLKPYTDPVTIYIMVLKFVIQLQVKDQNSFE